MPVTVAEPEQYLRVTDKAELVSKHFPRRRDFEDLGHGRGRDAFLSRCQEKTSEGTARFEPRSGIVAGRTE